VFRDDTSLSATPHLWPSIEQALGQSRFLILLASPEAAASRWVGQEIAYWLDHNSVDTVLIALTDGALNWDEATADFRWSEATPLPRVLKNRFRDEPRWIDLRPYRDGSAAKGAKFMGLSADFAAAIRGIPKEDLLSEEVRQQRRARRLQRDKARAELLAMQARRSESTWSDDRERSGALALESIEIARNRKQPAEAEAIEVVRNAFAGLPLTVLQHGRELSSLVALPDGRLASGGDDGKIRIWPAEGTGPPVVLSQDSWIWSFAVLKDGRLASGGPRRHDQNLAQGGYRRAGGPRARRRGLVASGAG